MQNKIMCVGSNRQSHPPLSRAGASLGCCESTLGPMLAGLTLLLVMGNAAAAASCQSMMTGLLRWNMEPVPMIAADLSALLDNDGNALQLGRSYAVRRKRIAVYDAVIDLPPSRDAVELRVVPDQEAAPGSYRVPLRSLKEGSKVEVVRLDERLMPRADGYISVFAASALLAPGAYELALTTEGAGPDTAQNTS